ncbi:MAG: hypothetical protein H6Q19_2106 [Bacteroidetes bacterium]|nr:hypothetical protein [Bacteroidota bacterium]
MFFYIANKSEKTSLLFYFLKIISTFANYLCDIKTTHLKQRI